MTNSLPKLLITGSSGQLGTALQHHERARDFSLIALGHAELDISNTLALDDIINSKKPDIIINTAAYTAVDKAESETSLAEAINHLGPAKLALICKRYSIPLIHVSTDYVFDGRATTPYQETYSSHPLNVYGLTKWRGEEAIRTQLNEHLILRVSGVFSAYGNNFLKTMLRLGDERETLAIVSDQTTCPTYAGHIADVIYQLASKLSHWGTYHYCDSPATTWYEFAREIFSAAAHWQTPRLKNLRAITTAEYPTAASRPLYSVLNCDKIQRDYGIHSSQWQDGIKASLTTLFNKKVIST